MNKFNRISSYTPFSKLPNENITQCGARIVSALIFSFTISIQIKPPVRLEKHNRALVRHSGFRIFLVFLAHALLAVFGQPS
jgi:hypothetical protein